MGSGLDAHVTVRLRQYSTRLGYKRVVVWPDISVLHRNRALLRKLSHSHHSPTITGMVKKEWWMKSSSNIRGTRPRVGSFSTTGKWPRDGRTVKSMRKRYQGQRQSKGENLYPLFVMPWLWFHEDITVVQRCRDNLWVVKKHGFGVEALKKKATHTLNEWLRKNRGLTFSVLT